MNNPLSPVEVNMQDALMRYDPAHGQLNPYPSHAQQYRNYHGQAAWLINPWSGLRRNAYDVGSDPFGKLIKPDVNYIRETRP